MLNQHTRQQSQQNCPECGENLAGNLGRVPASIDGDAVRLAVECPGCATALELAGVGTSIAPVEG